MKKLFFSAIALSAFSFGFAQKKADEVAKFKMETIDMGKLEQSNPTTATFVVTNIGTEPLIIEQANPTCGCTIGDYTKSPIAPGQSGEIKATYNAAGVGNFEKHLTVKFAGAEDMKSITIKGEVLTKDDYAKYKSGAGGSNTANSWTPAKAPEKAKATLAATPASSKANATKAKAKPAKKISRAKASTAVAKQK
ncbi:MAG: DUF1573 domain-containing protein [Ferruginibacter sp.]